MFVNNRDVSILGVCTTCIHEHIKCNEKPCDTCIKKCHDGFNYSDYKEKDKDDI